MLEGLMLAFEWFGGVPRNLWFDNLTPVVRRVLKGRDRELQRSFIAFEAHYGFRGQFCAPGKGNEKGGKASGKTAGKHSQQPGGKGSWYGRDNHDNDPLATKKDNDFRKREPLYLSE